MSRSFRYTDGVTPIVLTVPWGPGSGLIPPPVIAFGDVKFIYEQLIEEDS